MADNIADDENNAASLTERSFVPMQRQGEPDVLTRIDYPSMEYDMRRKKRKALVISNSFNDERFRTGFRTRRGSAIDVNNVFTMLQTLGFDQEDITYKEDLSCDGFRETFLNKSRQDFSDVGCFMCVILSYGAPGFVYGMDGKIGVNSLVKYFKGDRCPSLVGKPKIFCIQSCPPKEVDSPNAVRPEATGDENDRIVPVEADILLVHSCIAGLFTWANDCRQGSLFITHLTDSVQKLVKKTDFMTILTRMQKRIKEEIKERKIEKTKLPFISSTLSKDINFDA